MASCRLVVFEQCICPPVGCTQLLAEACYAALCMLWSAVTQGSACHAGACSPKLQLQLSHPSGKLPSWLFIGYC